MVNNWIDSIQYGLYPPRCLLCGAAGDGGRDLCAGCHRALAHNRHACPVCALPLPAEAPAGSLCGQCQHRPPHFDRCHAALGYDRLTARLIGQLKFHRRLSHARLLAQLLLDRLRRQAPERPGLILPVPLHPSRLRERGYNQALEIARPIARQFALPLRPGLCRRVRITPAQAGLDQRERRRNLREAFQVDGEVDGLHIALLDDVVTTGSTVNELSRTLKRAGARRVDVWAVARTPQPE